MFTQRLCHGAACAPLQRRSRTCDVTCYSSQAPRTTGRCELRLRSVAPVYTLSATGGLVGGITRLLQPQAEYFSGLGLPDALIKWGHPGNMAVVLVAMGLYGSAYLGWRLRLSDDTATVAKARALHPKLALGMTIFFALGGIGGMMSLLMQGKPIFSSPHVTSGLWGLGLLMVQGMLSLFFNEDESLKTAHAYLGSAIMALFVAHALFGLQLGLSI